LQGNQLPRVRWVPPYASSSGAEVIEVCELAGLHLDPWQAQSLTDALGENPYGKWASFEVGVMVSRQNGKGGLLEARELGGLFVLGERLIVHSAHQFDTSLEAFRRLLELIESAPDLDRMVKRVSRSHGEEGIELKTGQRIRFRTRTKGGGRGFSGDCLILDEAMILPASAHGALLPTLSARPNPQVWYTGSAVDQDVHEHGLVFARIRERGLEGDDPSLMYVEWSVDAELGEVTPLIASDPAAWAVANPGLGIRITPDYVGNEQRSLDARTFAVERLGVGDWPSLDVDNEDGITREMWADCQDESSVLVDPVSFAFDVTPDRTRAAISAAGRNEDGDLHVEIVEHKSGTKWLPGRLEDLVAKHKAGPVLLAARSPAAALIPKLIELGIPFEVVNGNDFAQACGAFFDDVSDTDLRHLGTPELTAAALGAQKKPVDDSWVWSRKKSSVDISPLVSATLARHAASQSRIEQSRAVAFL
jgi:hypothetical protein